MIRKTLLITLTLIPITSISFAARAAIHIDGMNTPTDPIQAEGAESGRG